MLRIRETIIQGRSQEFDLGGGGQKIVNSDGIAWIFPL